MCFARSIQISYPLALRSFRELSRHHEMVSCKSLGRGQLCTQGCFSWRFLITMIFAEGPPQNGYQHQGPQWWKRAKLFSRNSILYHQRVWNIEPRVHMRLANGSSNLPRWQGPTGLLLWIAGPARRCSAFFFQHETPAVRSQNSTAKMQQLAHHICF